MTLSELRERPTTIGTGPNGQRIHESVMRSYGMLMKVRKQLQHLPYQPGMNDSEFLDEVLRPFEEKIRTDREMDRIIEKQKRSK